MSGESREVPERVARRPGRELRGPLRVRRRRDPVADHHHHVRLARAGDAVVHRRGVLVVGPPEPRVADVGDRAPRSAGAACSASTRPSSALISSIRAAGSLRGLAARDEQAHQPRRAEDRRREEDLAQRLEQVPRVEALPPAGRRDAPRSRERITAPVRQEEQIARRGLEAVPHLLDRARRAPGARRSPRRSARRVRFWTTSAEHPRRVRGRREREEGPRRVVVPVDDPREGAVVADARERVGLGGEQLGLADHEEHLGPVGDDPVARSPALCRTM